MFSIYLISNDSNGKVYVGLTSKTIKYRFNQHVRYAKRNDLKTALYKAISIYGEKSFSIQTLETTDSLNNALELEKKWISFYNSYHGKGYNMTAGGETLFTGPKSEEHKRKIGEANKGNKRPDLIALNESRKGKKLSPSHRQNIITAQYKWISCLNCKQQVSTTEFNRSHNTNKHFGMLHGKTKKVK